MTGATVREIAPPTLYSIEAMIEQTEKSAVVWEVVRYRCFLLCRAALDSIYRAHRASLAIHYTDQLAADLQGIIHVPGLRGNPERVLQNLSRQ